DHLNLWEVTAPRLVCRVWNQVFSTRVWRSVTIRSMTALPSLDDINWNAHHIRDLTYDEHSPPEYFNLTCTYLTKLTINYSRTHRPDAWNHLAELVKRNNNSLQELTICDPSYTTNSAFWTSLSLCLQLRKVSIMQAKLEGSAIQAFWKGCMGLQSLIISGLQVHGVFFGRHRGVFHNMERIELESIKSTRPVDQIQVLRRTPNLRSLHLYGDMGRSVTIPTLTRLLVDGCLPFLESLHIFQTDEFSDDELFSCLQAMSRVTKLAISQCDFGWLHLSSLAGHFQWLKIFAVSGCESVTGAAVQLVLESCPSLKLISAPQIEASVIMNGWRWACLNLKSFLVSIVLDSKEYSIGCQSRMVYVQLARLTQLRVLSIKSAREQETQGLDLRLESGLYQLSSLRKLRFLCYSGTIQHISLEDVQWMREHWQLPIYPVPSRQ
ncbi:hypothetical protein BGZ52_007927, partial [Haplosporangium bisporale]